MKIGIDAKRLNGNFTGIAVYVSEMIRHFIELGKSDEFFLYSPKPIELNFSLPSNFHVVVYKSLSGTFGLITRLPSMLKKDGIELFWGTEHCIPLGKQPFKRVVTIHDLAVMHSHKLGTRYNYMIQRLIGIPSIKAADKIIAISKATAKDVEEYVDKNKIEVIYNGDSPYKYKKRNFTKEKIASILNKWDINEYGYFLFVGSIEPRKNLITLIKAYSKFRQETNSRLKLVLAGSLGWRYNKILREINISSYKEDIVLTGYVTDEDRECLYKCSCALTFPSLYEGFGFPILEAMSLGTPVITSNVSSMPEVAGNCALFLNNIYDSTELSSLLKKVSNYSLEERQEIAIRNMEQSMKFSRKECAGSILRLFHSL